MIINVAELRESGETLRVSVRFSAPEIGRLARRLKSGELTEATLNVNVVDDRIEVSGRLRGVLRMICARCLKEFAVDVDRSLQLHYWPDPEVEEDGEEIELHYEDLDTGFYRGDELDLTSVVSEQLLLEVPMKPICREDCKGLCPHCGADLNEGDCGCRTGAADPRLKELEKIRKRLTQ